MIYLDQASWDEFHRLLKEQKQRFKRWGRISERQKVWGQISNPATIKIRTQHIVKMTEETPRPFVVLVKIASSVGLEKKVQVSKLKIDLENDSSEECSNDEQGRDIDLAGKTTPIDMIIGDKDDLEKSHSAKLFELKAEIGEIIMPIVQHIQWPMLKNLLSSRAYLEMIFYSA
ncbi:hypothetical protein ACFX2K_034227 [Malus domestica]